MLLQSEQQHYHVTSDGPPTRRSERLRYKQEAKASLESALYRFVSKENGHVDVMATAAAGAGACGGGSEIPFSSSAVDAFLEESDFPSILITPSETKEDCLFGDSGDISHSFPLPPPPPPPPPGSSHLSPPLSSSSDMTPPTTPSLGFFSPSSSDAHPGAIFANHQSPFDSAFDDVSPFSLSSLLWPRSSLLSIFRCPKTRLAKSKSRCMGSLRPICLTLMTERRCVYTPCLS